MIIFHSMFNLLKATFDQETINVISLSLPIVPRLPVAEAGPLRWLG